MIRTGMAVVAATLNKPETSKPLPSRILRRS